MAVPLILDPEHYSADEVLRDGGAIDIRAICPDDKQRLLDHFHRLSRQSVYYRFLGIKRDLTHDDLVRLTELDFARHVGLVATLRSNGEEEIIGVSRYVVADRPPDSRRAEVAFAVIDGHQGRGIGTVLLEHLARIARARGIEIFDADVLGGNPRMLDVFEQSGFEVKESAEAGLIRVTFPIGATERIIAARRRHSSGNNHL